MTDKLNETITQKLIINGSNVTLNFQSNGDNQTLTQVKEILSTSFDKSVENSRPANLDNQISTQP